MKAGFSVAMATYNGARHLQEQLDSIRAQVLPPAELVVCDDGSTDATIDILTRFASGAPFAVRIEQNPSRLGFRDNFVKAASLCSEEFVAFSDQDDVWLPRKLEVLARGFQDERVMVATHSAMLVNEKLEPTGGLLPNHRTWNSRGPLTNAPLAVIPGFSLAFRSSLLADVPVHRRPRDVHGTHVRQAHDQLIPFLGNVLGWTAYMPDVLALYRRHANAVTGDPHSGAYRTGRLERARTAWRLRSQHRTKYAYRAAVAAEHAAFAAMMIGRTNGERSERWSRAEELYSWLRDNFRSRAALLDPQQTKLARADLLRKMLERRAYSRPWNRSTFDVRVFAKDVLFAAIL
jgi:glycosyltransferase involved in cell wall biosynthesis